jgi:hypothetical protein
VQVEAFADVAGQEYPRNGDRPGCHGERPGPDIEGGAVRGKNVAVGLLEVAGVGVVVRAAVEGRQDLHGGELPLRDGLQDALAGQQELRVLDARQP